MAVPKFKTSKSKTRKRRSHHALKSVHSEICSVSSYPRLSHHFCLALNNISKKKVNGPVEKFDKKNKYIFSTLQMIKKNSIDVDEKQKVEELKFKDIVVKNFKIRRAKKGL